jgi:hypothetical protein
MCQAAFLEKFIYSLQRCFDRNTSPKHLYTKMHMVDWWWETLGRRDTEG